MTTLAQYTQPDIQQLQIRRLQQMPAWRKLALVGEMNCTVRAWALAGLRRRHPDDGPAQLQRRLADLMLDPELAACVDGLLPEEG